MDRPTVQSFRAVPPIPEPIAELQPTEPRPLQTRPVDLSSTERKTVSPVEPIAPPAPAGVMNDATVSTSKESTVLETGAMRTFSEEERAIASQPPPQPAKPQALPGVDPYREPV
jgi:hypothetical protein